MRKMMYRAFFLAIFLFVLIGICYPFVVYLIGKNVFPYQSGGSLIFKENAPVGSALIGQKFTSVKYFHGRPLAISPLPATSQELMDRMESSIQQVLKENPDVRRDEIPVDLVTASGSGVDPDISVAAALIQVSRIAKARHLSKEQVQNIVKQHAVLPIFGFIGEPRVRVLDLNLALDKLP